MTTDLFLLLHQEDKKEIEKVLESLYFVEWDRFCMDEVEISIYGWIKRDQDSYKDFALVAYDLSDKTWNWITSSAAKDAEMAKIMATEETNPCQRVEKTFNILNSIKI